MAPAKKVDDKAKDQTAAQISVEDFIRTRDSVSYTHFLWLCLASSHLGASLDS